MQIGNRVVNNYDANIQDHSILEQAKSSECAKNTQSAENLANLKEGTVFRGEILDIVGEKVKIAMENHSELLARLQGSVELGVGDQLLFSVKENTTNQILIKPLFDSLYSAQTQVLERALDAAGLSPTEKNFSVAKELMEAGMPLDKGNMVKLLSQSMKYEGASMKTLTALNKMNIPVTEGNIVQYERYQSYQHQLSNDILTAVDGMTSFTQSFPEGTGETTLISVAKQILDMFASDAGEQKIPTAEQGKQVSTQEVFVNGQNLISEKGITSGAQDTTLLKTENDVTEYTIDKKKIDVASQNTESVMTESSLEKTLQKEKMAAKNMVTISQMTEHTKLTKEGITHLSEVFKKVGVTGEQFQNIFRHSNSSEEMIKNMLQTLTTSGGDEQAIRNVLDSKEFRDMLSDVIKKHWALNPKDMRNPKEIDELYDKIVKQSKSFENLIASHGGEPKQFEQSFQNMRQNMQFMEQLNNQMIYAQMPLKLSNQNTNSELYVYADKRKLAQKRDGISVMLHLDMDHLGQTDVKITLTGSNVNARFYLNDHESVDIVAENMDQLAKQLADRGFSLTNEVVKRQPQESINQVVDEIIDENAERSIKRYTFDART